MAVERTTGTTVRAGAALPDVERIKPDVWSIPVPLPIPGVSFVLVYAFVADQGIYLVDAGWDTAEGMAALASGLAGLGGSITDVRGVVVTHAHPDHFGLATRIREQSGAWVAIHRRDAEIVSARFSEEPPGFTEQTARLIVRFGVPDEEHAEIATTPLLARPSGSLAPDILLDDAERLAMGGRDLRVVLTPGHSPGHICLWDERDALLMSGDCVLPRIRPSLAFDPDRRDDPLADYLRSLDVIEALKPAEVLPGHEFRFVDLQARLDQLRRHHARRCERALEAVSSGAQTAWEIAPQMHAERWVRPDGRRRRAAMVEAAVHLRHLSRKGALSEALRSGVFRWSSTA